MSFLFWNHLDGEERTGCFPLIVFWMYCDCKCSMALPQSAMGRSAVSGCGTSYFQIILSCLFFFIFCTRPLFTALIEMGRFNVKMFVIVQSDITFYS